MKDWLMLVLVAVVGGLVALSNAITTKHLNEMSEAILANTGTIAEIDQHVNHLHNFDFARLHKAEEMACFNGEHPACRVVPGPAPRLQPQRENNNGTNRNGHGPEIEISSKVY